MTTTELPEPLAIDWASATETAATTRGGRARVRRLAVLGASVVAVYVALTVVALTLLHGVILDALVPNVGESAAPAVATALPLVLAVVATSAFVSQRLR